MIPNILSIAGSDPSGGAGIQADLKTFAALGAYGMAAITALTAQNTQGVSGVHELPAGFVGQQVETVFADIRVDAVKIGMAGSPETIRAIAAVLEKHQPRHIVLDPVMVAQSGDRLLSDESVAALKKYLIPLATIITPNIPEAEMLLAPSPQPSPHGGEGVAAALRRVRGKMQEQDARDLLKQGAHAVLLKGGHMEGPICFDIYADLKKTIILEAPRIHTKNNHGTGCTLSSALAVYLAQGLDMEESCRAAKNYITEALRHADRLSVGQGHGPVNHFWSHADE